MSSRLRCLEFFPLDVKTLKNYLNQRAALHEAVHALFKAVNGATKEVDLTLRRIVLLLNADSPPPEMTSAASLNSPLEGRHLLQDFPSLKFPLLLLKSMTKDNKCVCVYIYILESV